MRKVLIIAEAGVNHNGDMEKARRLIDVAAESGADYVKFQSFKASKLVSKKAKRAEYQQNNVGDEKDDQLSMLEALELSDEDHLMLVDYCKSKSIEFLSTAFDEDGLTYLYKLGLRLFKSPSGEITNYPYLRKMSQLADQLILSTGMADLEEIGDALELLSSYGFKKEKITVLHCNTDYPTAMNDVNLQAMNSIGEHFGVSIGYSDHTLGIEVPIAAVAMGATVIEKHFTLDRDLPGPDHRASLEPDELVAMVRGIRNIESALSGSGLKEPSESEKKNKLVARRSIHMAVDVPVGTVLSEEHLITLRPGNGISPMKWPEIVGRKTSRNLIQGDILQLDDLVD